MIQSLQAGDIATRVDQAVQTGSQNLRTVQGASTLTRLINNQGALGQQQVALLRSQRDIQRRLVTVTEKGFVAWEV
jgi:hypothetical protein